MTHSSPPESLTWEWLEGTLQATAAIYEPAGVLFTPTLSWRGTQLEGTCQCSVENGAPCGHQVALALHLLKIDPWRQPAPDRWSDSLELVAPSKERYQGETLFVYRAEIWFSPGDPVGRLRIRLAKARWGRSGLGQQSPYPALRLRGVNLDTLPPLERSLLTWLLPLQPWVTAKRPGYTADPRFLDVPAPLVASALRALLALERCYFGETGQLPIVVSEQSLRFSLEPQPLDGGRVRFKGLLHLPQGTSSLSSSDNEPKAFVPEVVVGERPSFALRENVLYPIDCLSHPGLWQYAHAGELVVPKAEIAEFLESYFPSLVAQEVMSLEAFTRAVPGVVVRTIPKPILSLHEDEGALVGLLSFEYGPDIVLPGGATRPVEPLEAAGQHLLICRDAAAEQAAVATLREAGFDHAGGARLEARGEPALDFLLNRLSGLLAAGWRVEGEDGLKDYRPSRRPVRVRGIVTSGEAWFDLELTFSHGSNPVFANDVFRAWQEGRRFVRFGDGTQALLPEAWLARNRTLLSVALGSALPEGLSSSDAAAALPVRLKLPHYAAPLLEGLSGEEAELELDEAARNFQIDLHEFGGMQPVTVPSSLKTELRAYQCDGLRWLCFLRDHGLGGILADDMGLGKTVQALALLLQEKERSAEPRSSLVVAPTSVLFNWEAETARFAPSLKTMVLHGIERNMRTEDEPCDLYITSYALLRRDIEIHRTREYHYVILDEAQLIKNPDSQTAAAVRSLNASHRLTLTGTPIENHLTELWSHFAFLMPGLFPSLRSFVSDYVTPIERERSSDHLTALKRRIRPFVLRRLKHEVASELPPRTDLTLFCELEGGQKRLYQAVLEHSREKVLQAIADKGLPRARFMALDALLKLRQICCHPALVHLPEAVKVEGSAKLELFRDTLLEVLSDRHRVLVFSQFVQMLTVLKAELEAADIPYEYLDGRTRDRRQRVERFNAGAVPVFLISLRAGGTGLNLATADYVIHYDPWWNPAVEDQATDRAHRIGQLHPVFSYKLIARQTIEEKMLSLQERKRALAGDILSAQGTLEEMLSQDDLTYLFADDGIQ